MHGQPVKSAISPKDGTSAHDVNKRLSRQLPLLSWIVVNGQCGREVVAKRSGRDHR